MKQLMIVRVDMTKLGDKVEYFFRRWLSSCTRLHDKLSNDFIKKCYSMITFKTDLIALTDYLAFYDRHIGCYFSPILNKILA